MRHRSLDCAPRWSRRMQLRLSRASTGFRAANRAATFASQVATISKTASAPGSCPPPSRWTTFLTPVSSLRTDHELVAVRILDDHVGPPGFFLRFGHEFYAAPLELPVGRI